MENQKSFLPATEKTNTVWACNATLFIMEKVNTLMQVPMMYTSEFRALIKKQWSKMYLSKNLPQCLRSTIAVQNPYLSAGVKSAHVLKPENQQDMLYPEIFSNITPSGQEFLFIQNAMASSTGMAISDMFRTEKPSP